MKTTTAMATKLKTRTSRTSTPSRGARESYFSLFRAFPIRPIRSEKELDEAIEVARKLFCRGKPLNRAEDDYFQLLSHEIERYEAVAYPMPPVPPAEMLRHLMEGHDTTLSKVADGSGVSLSTLSAVLNGKRKLNLTHIRSLASYFGVEPSVFLD